MKLVVLVIIILLPEICHQIPIVFLITGKKIRNYFPTLFAHLSLEMYFIFGVKY